MKRLPPWLRNPWLWQVIIAVALVALAIWQTDVNKIADSMQSVRPEWLLVALLIRSMDALRIFDHIYIMTMGGPGGATEVSSLYLYKTAFKFSDFGYAAAGLFVLLVGITLLRRAYIRLLGREAS